MKTFKIQLFDENNILEITFISQHIDCTRHTTLFFDNVIDDLIVTEFIIPENIDHINIFEGLITIYYINGKFVEISKLNKISYRIPETHHGVNVKGKVY